MTLVAGVDSSTQSCKVIICDAADGTVRRSGTAPHPPGTEVSPEHWWLALRAAIASAGGLDDVDAISIAGQQHGMVCLDQDGVLVRDALLWNDTRSAAAATELVAEIGREAWVDAVGVLPVAAITVAKLRWLADHEPDHARQTAAVCLPHDWLTWRLRGGVELGIDALTTDRSDASGTGYYAAADDDYRPDLVALAMGSRPLLPRVLGPDEIAGHVDGIVVGAGMGDNAGAALGLGALPGDGIVSLGTSGVVSVIADTAPRDPAGLVAGFADATGRQLPLVCTLNGAPVLSAAAQMLGVDLATLSSLAMSAPAGADGLVLMPYLAGERSPNLPHARGSLHGMTTATMTPAHVARAAVEGLLCSLEFCQDRIERQGIAIDRVLLTGGGSRSAAVAELAPAILGRDVTVCGEGEFVALGAARQAAWALLGELPRWPRDATTRVTRADPTPEVVARYREVAESVAGPG